MVSSISSASSAAQAYQAQQPAPKPAPAKPAAQDTVQLSKTATGDVDHDGDSH